MTQDNHISLVEHLVSMLKDPAFKTLKVIQVGNPAYFELAGTGQSTDKSEVFLVLHAAEADE